MRVILVRHAEAVPHEDAGSDRDRWLSLRGREMARGLARLLRDQSIEPDAIVASPLPRAVQTAELVAGAVDFVGVVEVLPALAPGAHPRVAANELASRGAAVMVVGHEPGISALGAFLLGKPGFPPFRTAQACVLEDGAPTFTARADIGQVLALFVE
jgi:phosphohistidine phosphatase